MEPPARELLEKSPFPDEKIFRMSEHRHGQNDGLWITAQDPNPEDVAESEHVVDRHSSKLCVWVGFAHCGKAELCLFAEHGEVLLQHHPPKFCFAVYGRKQERGELPAGW